MTRAQATARAATLAKQTGKEVYVCSYDSQNLRTYAAYRPEEIDDEFEAFDGVIHEIVEPE